MNMRWRFAAGFVILLVIITLLVGPIRQNTQPTTSPNPIPTNIRADRPVQALFQLERSAADTGWEPELARQAGNAWQQLDLAQAVRYWEMAAKNSNSDAPLLKQLAQSYLDLQRWSDAAVALTRLVAITPDDNWAHYHLGILQAAFNPTQAIDHLQLAARDSVYRPVTSDLTFLTEGNPNDALFVMKVGVRLATHQLWADAERVFLYAASLDRSRADALAYAGLARDKQGKNGMEQINQAVELDPDNAQVRYLQGLHLRQAEDDSGSLEAFLQAASLEPSNPAYAAELGSAYQRVSNLAQAEYWLKQAVTLSNKDPRFQDLLDQFYAQIPSFSG